MGVSGGSSVGKGHRVLSLVWIRRPQGRGGAHIGGARASWLVAALVDSDGGGCQGPTVAVGDGLDVRRCYTRGGVWSDSTRSGSEGVAADVAASASAAGASMPL